MRDVQARRQSERSNDSVHPWDLGLLSCADGRSSLPRHNSWPKHPTLHAKSQSLDGHIMAKTTASVFLSVSIPIIYLLFKVHIYYYKRIFVVCNIHLLFETYIYCLKHTFTVLNTHLLIPERSFRRYVTKLHTGCMEMSRRTTKRSGRKRSG